MKVWLDAWQMQCCGDPFAVGDQVTWTLGDEPDRDWLRAAVGDDVARSVTHAEEHHGGLPDDHPATQGRVVAITGASARYAPEAPGSRTLHPVPGSAVLRKVERATGWEPEPGDERFNGYVVDLLVTDAAR